MPTAGIADLPGCRPATENSGLLRGRPNAVGAVEEALTPRGQLVGVEVGRHVEVLDTTAVAAPRPAQIADTAGPCLVDDGVLVHVAVGVLPSELTDHERQPGAPKGVEVVDDLGGRTVHAVHVNGEHGVALRVAVEHR